MNVEQQNQIIAEARAHWDAGLPAVAGMWIFEHISLDDRPLWAADLLEAVYQHIQTIPEVTAVLGFAREPELWPQSRHLEAHEIFSAVRQLNRGAGDALYFQILDLAEDAAGVIYTARQYPAPFDYDRGWRIVERYHRVIKQLSIDESQVWNIVANQGYIRSNLDAPMRCIVGCPVCNMEASKEG